ncbi:MAG: hypothetical protein K0S55_213, partial [Clostridia bacterium]|nr:hypothetical protein [Clostridia bacterium]
MICAAIFSVIYIFIILFELIPFFKAKRIKEGIIYSVILAFAFFIQNFFTKELDFLNPNILITNIVEYFI